MKTLVIIAIGLAVGVSASVARADESLEGLLSQEIVTSVSRSAEAASSTPALTRSISADDIRRYGMTSVDEALDFLGVGVHAQQRLGRTELTVRGVTFTGDRGNHILLLVDGHVINEPLFGDASYGQRLGVPLELIDHIELVLGPGSAIYGSSAVLAVINVVTKSAGANAGIHAAAEVTTSGTQRISLTSGSSFDVLGKRTSVTTGLQFYRRDGEARFERQNLADGVWGGTASRSVRFDVPGVHVRLVRDRLEVVGRAVIAATGDPAGVGDFDHPDSGSLERRASLGVYDSFALGHVGELSAGVYGSVYRNRHRVVISRQTACPLGGLSCAFREDEGSSRLGAELRTTFDWRHDGRFVSALGVTGSVDRVSASTEASIHGLGRPLLPTTPSLDIESVLNLAANAQQTLKVTRWVDVDAGARVDWRKIADADGESHTFQPVLTPRLAATVRPWSGAAAKLIYAEAFRAPNPYESDARSIALLRSAPLHPERVTSTEAIFEQRIDTHRVTMGIFRSVYEGIIERRFVSAAEVAAAVDAGLSPQGRTDPNAVLSQYRAEEETTSHGFNAGVDGAALQQRFRYGASFTGAVVRTDGESRMPIAPQSFGNARASYDLGGALPIVALATSFAGPALSDRAYEAGFARPPFAPPSLELRATVTGDVPWVKGLSYRAFVSHQLHDRTAFAVGPTLRGQPGVDAPFLAPTQRWNALLGLQYDFGR